MSKTIKYLIAYLMWAVDIALGFWTVLLFRQTLVAGLTAFYLNGGFQRKMIAQFWDRAGILGIGLAWLIFIIIVEEYLRVGVAKNVLARRIARTTGPMVLFIAALDLFLGISQGLLYIGLLRWIVIILELAVGGFITWFGFRRLPAKTPLTPHIAGVQ